MSFQTHLKFFLTLEDKRRHFEDRNVRWTGKGSFQALKIDTKALEKNQRTGSYDLLFEKENKYYIIYWQSSPPVSC